MAVENGKVIADRGQYITNINNDKNKNIYCVF